MTQDLQPIESTSPNPVYPKTQVLRHGSGHVTSHTLDNPLPPDRRARRRATENPSSPIDWETTIKDTIKTVTTSTLALIPASIIGQGDVFLTGIAAFFLQSQFNFHYERLILRNREYSYGQIFFYNFPTAIAAGAIAGVADLATQSAGYLTAGQEIARNVSQLWNNLITSVRHFQLPSFNPPDISSPVSPPTQPEIRPPSPPLVDFDHIRSQLHKDAVWIASMPAIILGGLGLYHAATRPKPSTEAATTPDLPPQ